MQRANNPLPDRLAFFWHRHWAISRDDGSVSYRLGGLVPQPAAEVLGLPANPALEFREMAYEITTGDAAMSAYLNLNANIKTKPNENYARELMELFCLGPTAPGRDAELHPDRHRGPHACAHRLAAGQPRDDRRRRRGGRRTRTTGRSPSRPASSTCRSRTSSAARCPRSPAPRARSRPTNLAWGPASVNAAIDIVLAHRAARAVPDPQAVGRVHRRPDPAGDARHARQPYESSNYKLRPVIRGILSRPADLRVARRAEPDQAADRLRRGRAAPARRRR